MPVNNNLKPVKLPMTKRFGEKPITKFENNLMSIKVDLIDAPSIEQLRNYLPMFLTATWSERPQTMDSKMSIQEKDDEIIKCFNGKSLPTALETIGVTFLIEGISLQEVTHIIRHRAGSFSAECSGDKWWTNKDSLVPNSIQNSKEFYERYKDITVAAKKLYTDMIDSKQISIMDARYILPRNLETFYHMRTNLKDAINFIRQRMDKQIQPETDNIIAYQMYVALIKQFKHLMKGVVDIKSPSHFYVKMARSGRATNLYFPDKDSDIFEYHEDDFIYKTTRDKLNGTDKNAINKFNQMFKSYYKYIIWLENLYEEMKKVEYKESVYANK